MMTEKESIDLMNVDYGDILHLYRGWKRAESALKDKNKELAILNNRINQLQEAHLKFRNQIEALESVKELTVSLQNQLSIMQQENFQLTEENKELANLNKHAENLLQEKVQTEEKQTKLLQSIQIEFATLKGRYDETIKTQRELENLAAEERAMRTAAEERLKTTDGVISSARDESRELRKQLNAFKLKIHQTDQELAHASEQLSILSKEVAENKNTKNMLSSSESEAGILKGDIARLLRLMESSPATKEFIENWIDSGGMNFVGIPGGRQQKDLSGIYRSGNTSHLFHDADDLDLEQSRSQIDNMLTTAEFAHMKRIHGGDPFPMTASFMDEAEYWVPSEAAKLGVGFMAARIPHAPPNVIMDFLRSMNKIWLRRERRKIKRVKSYYGQQIEDLKRQVSQTKPYEGVIQKREIKRLKSQVKESRAKGLKGRAKKPLEADLEAWEMFEDVDQVDDAGYYSEHKDSSVNDRRPCRVLQRHKDTPSANIHVVSQGKLLEASLHTLETVGRHQQYGADANATSYSAVDESVMDKFPNESYLRGAMWLGKNFTILSEQLGDAVDSYRTQYLADLHTVANDGDVRRCNQRLLILASSGINEVHSQTNRCRMQIRELLNGCASLSVGDTRAYQSFLGTLPIESALAGSGATTNQSRILGSSQSKSFAGSPVAKYSKKFPNTISSPLFNSFLSQSDKR